MASRVGISFPKSGNYVRVCDHVSDFNMRNKWLTAKLLNQGYRYVNSTKKGKRKVQGVPQSKTTALPRHQEEEETDKTKQAEWGGGGGGGLNRFYVATTLAR